MNIFYDLYFNQPKSLKKSKLYYLTLFEILLNLTKNYSSTTILFI